MGDARPRRPVHSLPVLVAVAILVGACAGPVPSNPPGPSANPGSSASHAPSAAPSASTTLDPTASPRPDGWAQVDLPDLPQVATLEPVKASAGAVSTDTTFRLRSLDGRPPAELARNLGAVPGLAFEVESVEGDTAVLRPTGGLEPHVTYRISLTRADGTTEASWVARAAGPLQVTDTIPGDASTGVPRDTGIEIAFDQYGVTTADLARFFSIRPAVAGRFEAAGRTIAFVPDRPLAKGRLYTVTVRHGLPLAGTGEVLPDDVVFRFETAAKVPSKVTAWFPRALVESSTVEKAAIAIAFDGPSGKVPRTLAITIHRVTALAAAQTAWAAIVDAPEWTRVSTVEPVSTAGLDRVFAGDVRLRRLDEAGTRWLTVPVRLAAGWYVVTERFAGIPRQTLLQVGDVATFAMLATDRTAVWTNDLRTHGTAVGAAVTLGGRELGRTDDRGLLVADTPQALADGNADEDAFLVVRHKGQTSFRPVMRPETSCGGCEADDVGYGYGYGYGWGSGDDEWWRLLYTDRATYRTTDTVNAWGVVRDRDTAKVPGSVSLAVRALGDGGEDVALRPLVQATAEPDTNGAFTARLELRELPVGPYRVDLVADGDTIAQTWIEVATILKPAWRMELDTDRHAVIAGSKVRAEVVARFFEGTPVAGARISLYDDADDEGLAIRTDALGEGETTIRIPRGSCQADRCPETVEAYATLPEEGDIHASAEFMVFSASALVDVEAAVSGQRLRVAGKVSDVVLSRFERPGVDIWEVDPRGAGRPGATVSLRVVESWSVERQVGTEYSFIEKRAVPVYEYDYRTRQVADRTVRTGQDGTFALRLDVRGGDRSYEVSASYVDEAGRETWTGCWATTPDDQDEDWDGGAALVGAGDHPESDGYEVGETVRVRFLGDVREPLVERYLYAIAQRGLRYVTVGTSPTFRTTFERSSLPSIWITGVRFNGRGYETAVSAYEASVELASRQLTVKVIPDRDGYAPGDTASVTVRTLDPDGSPVPASVYVSVVDEKLYAIGAADEHDLLEELYWPVGDDVIAVVTSHATPGDDRRDGGADTMGGDGEDERGDFRDWLLSTLVTTNAGGRATVKVPLSDDLTSWRVTASAVDGALSAGAGTGRLEVGLPFFAEATIAAEYLEADRPVIRVRGFGSGLVPDDRVTYTVSSDTLPMAPVTVRAKAFRAAEVPLPPLSLGTHEVRIEARAGGGRSDTLVRTFRVVASRASRLSTTWLPLDAATGLSAGLGTTFTRVLLVDAGRGRVIPVLCDLAWRGGTRADQLLAVALANRVLVDSFGMEAETAVEDDALGGFWREDGLSLVAYGSARLDVTALAAMTGDPNLGRSYLRGALEAVAFKDSARRDRRLLALAGLAGLGEPVLGEIHAAAAQTDLTLPEQVSLALAALYGGDEALAGRLERSLLEAHGLAYGPWLRLDTGNDEDDAIQTARLAIVAASLGDPVAADMDAWLAARPPTTTVIDLERALAARGWAQRVAGAPAVAAVTVDGIRREAGIRPGSPVALQLTAAQAATMRLEPVSGSVLVVTSQRVPLDPDALTKPSGVSMTRGVSPAGSIGPADTVIVKLRVSLGKAARRDSWTVSELVPSGLAPIWGRGDDEGEWERGTVSPDWTDGQRVTFTIGGDPKVGEWTLRYVARVVTPGRYRWEPAVLQSDLDPSRGLVLRAFEVEIEGLGG